MYFYDTSGEPSWVVVASDGTVLVNQGDADLASITLLGLNITDMGLNITDVGSNYHRYGEHLT